MLCRVTQHKTDRFKASCTHVTALPRTLAWIKWLWTHRCPPLFRLRRKANVLVTSSLNQELTAILQVASSMSSKVIITINRSGGMRRTVAMWQTEIDSTRRLQKNRSLWLAHLPDQ